MDTSIYNFNILKKLTLKTIIDNSRQSLHTLYFFGVVQRSVTSCRDIWSDT